MQKFNKEKLEIADGLTFRFSIVMSVLLIFICGELGLFSVLSKISTGWAIALLIVVLVLILASSLLIVMWCCGTLLDWISSVVTFLEQHQNSISAGRDSRYKLKEQLREQEKAIIFCQNEIAKLKEHTNSAKKENLHKVARKLL